MRFPYDQFSKQLVRAAAEGLGTGTTDAEITPDAQRADFYYEPDPARRAERPKLGLLGRVLATLDLIEFFSKAPSVEAVRACLRKLLVFWHARLREARKHGKAVMAPMLWILAAGRPEAALRAFGFVPARGFLTGVYRAAAALRVRLVVASELPRDRSTLLVRLLAGGRGLRPAMEDLKALPPDAPEHALATPVLLRLRHALMGKRRPTREEREFIMDTQNIVQELVEKGRREGRAESQRTAQELVKKGRREALRDVEELLDKGRPEGQRIVQELVEKGRREGRLKEARAALRSVLTKRGLATSAEDEAKIDACARTATLRRWLDQAIDASSAAEALR